MAEQQQPEKQQKKKTIVKKRTADKWKKKSWYTVFSSKEFAAKEIGTKVAEKPENIIGRTVKISVRDLAGQARQQHVSIIFKVDDVKGNKAHSKAVGHSILESYMKKFVRNRNSKIQLTQLLNLPGGEKMLVTSVTLASRVDRKKETAIRKIMAEKINEVVALGNSQKIISELVFGNIPQEIVSVAKKVAPIKRIEITKSKLFSSK